MDNATEDEARRARLRKNKKLASFFEAELSNESKTCYLQGSTPHERFVYFVLYSTELYFDKFGLLWNVNIL